MSSEFGERFSDLSSFRRAWLGLEDLWLVYWVYGVVFGNIISYVFGKAMEFLPFYIGLFLIIPVIAFYIWLNVAIWRCAKNSELIWNILAKITVFISALSAVWHFWYGFQNAT